MKFYTRRSRSLPYRGYGSPLNLVVAMGVPGFLEWERVSDDEWNEWKAAGLIRDMVGSSPPEDPAWMIEVERIVAQYARDPEARRAAQVMVWAWDHWILGSQYDYEGGLSRFGMVPPSLTRIGHTRGYGGYGQEYHLAPGIIPSRTEAVGIAPLAPYTGINPNAGLAKVSPLGPVLVGAGILGAVATLATRGKLSPTMFGTAIGTSALAAAGGAVKTVIDVKRRSTLDEILDEQKSPATFTEKDAAIPMERDMRVNGQGFACFKTDVPKVVCEAKISNALNFYHRPFYEGPAQEDTKNPLVSGYAPVPGRGSIGVEWKPWYEYIFGIDAADLNELQSAGVTRLGSLNVGGGNWAICGRVRNTIYTSLGMKEARIEFLEAGSNAVLCGVWIKWPATSPSGSHRLFMDDFGVTYGDFDNIPDAIVMDGTANVYLRELSDGTPTGGDDPLLLVPTAPESERLPMATVQTLYRMLRTYQPLTVSMVGHPLAWALVTHGYGDHLTIKNGWVKVWDIVKKVLGIATSVASVCYPALSAIAPTAVALISNVSNGIINNLGTIKDEVAGWMGKFDGIYDDYAEIFRNWQRDVMEGTIPSSWRDLVPSRQMEQLVNAEFQFTQDQFLSNWVPRLSSMTGQWEVPTTPFFLESVKQYIPKLPGR